ncbi:MAG: helix-turn-helix domain-containing protein [Candidatus Acidiferrum sp.]
MAKTNLSGNVRNAQRNLKIRDRLFPQSASFVFDTKKGGFAPAPIILRKLLNVLTPTQMELLLYLMLRADQNGLCFPTHKEIAHELKREKNLSRLRKTFRELETMGIIEIRVEKGRTYFLVRDPRHAVPNLYAAGKFTEEDIAGANDLMKILGLKEIPVPKGSS